MIKNTCSHSDQKLFWNFQNKSGRGSRDELHGILMTLLQMENISEIEADELVTIFEVEEETNALAY